MARPRAILFDVMDTLVRDPVWEALPQFFEMPLEELMAKKHPTVWPRFERAEVDEQQFHRIFLEGQDWDYDALRERLKRSYVFFDGIEDLLVELQDAGHTMLSLSNYPIWYEIIEEKLQLSRFMAWDLVSHNTGIRKPDEEVYLGAARHLGLEPQDCLFVDNSIKNVEGARAVGMPAILFESVPKLRLQLARDFDLLPTPRVIEVVGAAILEDQRCLVCQRAEDMAAPLKWEFPGGKVEPGESPRQALAREIKEELGLTIEVGEHIETGYGGGRERIIALAVYKARKLSGELKLREHAQARWIGAGAIEALDWAEPDVPVLPHLARLLGEG